MLPTLIFVLVMGGMVYLFQEMPSSFPVFLLEVAAMLAVIFFWAKRLTIKRPE
jgi:hypothetical protein